jgi:hypothetical protein
MLGSLVSVVNAWDRRIGTGAGFLRVLCFALLTAPPTAPHPTHSIISDCGNMPELWPTYQVDCLTPPQQTKKN